MSLCKVSICYALACISEPRDVFTRLVRFASPSSSSHLCCLRLLRLPASSSLPSGHRSKKKKKKLSDHSTPRPSRKHASPRAGSPYGSHCPKPLAGRARFGNLIAGLEMTILYIGRFRTFFIPPFTLDTCSPFLDHSSLSSPLRSTPCSSRPFSNSSHFSDIASHRI